jgi:nucleotide-binding universal stress UspA family protein
MSTRDSRRLPSVRGFEVVVGIDYSKSAEQALATAFDMARRRTGSHVHVVAVAEGYGPRMSEDLTVDAREAFLTEASATLESTIDEVLSRRQILLNRKSIFSIVEFGDPAETLLKVARDVSANLIVVGTHGKGPLEQVLLGSVSMKVLRDAPCTVLVVKPAQDQTAPTP